MNSLNLVHQSQVDGLFRELTAQGFFYDLAEASMIKDRVTDTVRFGKCKLTNGYQTVVIEQRQRKPLRLLNAFKDKAADMEMIFVSAQ